jgi:hypothetical protein
MSGNIERRKICGNNKLRKSLNPKRISQILNGHFTKLYNDELTRFTSLSKTIFLGQKKAKMCKHMARMGRGWTSCKFSLGKLVKNVHLKDLYKQLTIQVLKTTSVKMTVFWDVVLCSLVEMWFHMCLLPPPSWLTSLRQSALLKRRSIFTDYTAQNCIWQVRISQYTLYYECITL